MGEVIDLNVALKRTKKTNNEKVNLGIASLGLLNIEKQAARAQSMLRDYNLRGCRQALLSILVDLRSVADSIPE
jgi:hypothetical protein